MDYRTMSEELFHRFNRIKGSLVPPRVKWLSEGDSKALDYLANNHDGALSGAIAVGMGLSSGRTSLILKSLEKKGYITRHLDKQDERRVHINLSKKGLDYLEKIRAESVDGFACFLEAMGEEKAQTTYELLAYLLDHKDEFLLKIAQLRLKEGLGYAKAEENR